MPGQRKGQRMTDAEKKELPTSLFILSGTKLCLSCGGGPVDFLAVGCFDFLRFGSSSLEFFLFLDLLEVLLDWLLDVALACEPGLSFNFEEAPSTFLLWDFSLPWPTPVSDF